MADKTHYKDFFKSNLLNDSDFNYERDTVVKVLEIKDIMVESRDGNQLTTCLLLEGMNKPMKAPNIVLTNMKRALKSPYIEDWAGKYIAVYVEKGLRAFGGEHDVLRVRPVAPKPPKVYPPASVDQIKLIRDGFKEIKQSESEYLVKAKLTKLEDLKEDRAQIIINHIETKRKS